MARMHSYYISNTKDEVKSAYQELNETEFEQVIIQSRLPFDTLTDEEANNDSDDSEDDDDDEEEEDDDDDDTNTSEEQQVSQVNQNCLSFEELVDVDDQELQHVLGIQVSVVIPSYEIVEHGDTDFDIESILENAMSKR